MKETGINVDAVAKQYSSDLTQKSANPLTDNEGYESNNAVFNMESDYHTGVENNIQKAVTDVEEEDETRKS